MQHFPIRPIAEFKFLAFTPAGTLDPSIAIAASRAGETGVLDLEYAPSKHEDVLTALQKLGRHARTDCGVKLSGDDAQFASLIADRLPDCVRFAILTPSSDKNLARCVDVLRARNLHIFLEATNAEHLRAGDRLAVDAFVAKGHEAGGRCSEETAFILLQRFVPATDRPVYIQGGVGLHTVSASYAAGAAGVVLCDQLALTKESALPAHVQDAVARMDGSETEILGDGSGNNYRVYRSVASTLVDAFRRREETHMSGDEDAASSQESWGSELREHFGWGADQSRWIWPIGQDACFASSLSRRFKTVGGVLQTLRKALADDVERAANQASLDEHGPLAASHGTRFPIVQGPMTRVSDTVEFARAVADGGGLPFLALALMRGTQASSLLRSTAARMAGRPWGVGILGFVPPDLRAEQLEALLDHPPTYALIAGGRPDQAKLLEDAGIPTYLHVPSPGLLRLFVEQGARRFVFEGRECGGHVGPRTSFVLWNTMIEVLLEELSDEEIAECHVLFAGGVHDGLSSSMVSCMAAPLAEKGARIGVLMGTAYLFTEEAVAAGAIAEGFQQEAIAADRTVLLHTAPGHATRCARTPFVDVFESKKAAFVRKGAPHEKIAEALERLNIGRLRIASKGMDRHPKYGKTEGVDKFVAVDPDRQRAEGMYMMGQLAALRSERCTIEALHLDVSAGGGERLRRMAALLPEGKPALTFDEKSSDIAIIGMSCLLPKAPDLSTYRSNILNKVDAITEVPANRWDWQAYYDPDPAARDKIYSKWGGYLDDVLFDPMQYGMPPASLPSIEPLQLLTLVAVRAVLDDAGYLDRSYDKERTSVILGVGGGTGDLGQKYAVRSGLPSLFESTDSKVWDELPEWTEDSFAGILLNVAAGRVANRFDFGGVNYTVDAACASSLAAVYHAVRELETGASDMVVVGGADTVQNPFGYLCFSKTRALSPRGRCRTFDESADGIVISEGIALLVLKRLADAERDGDRIYAVIKGVAGSSDGRDKGLTAPRPAGQVRALERAYRKAGFSPSTVGLIEAHGTGTVAGDQAEIESLMTVFGQAGAERQSCAIGSVKSMIGHTKCAAGVAGLIKIALALHDRVLPPTLHVDRPNPRARFHESAFYVNNEPRPWLTLDDGIPRRAGVSAFGFGGTNFHAVLEEYTGAFNDTSQTFDTPVELLLWKGDSREEIAASMATLHRQLVDGAHPVLADLAFSLWEAARSCAGAHTFALVCKDIPDLLQKLDEAVRMLADDSRQSIDDPRGIYFEEMPAASDGAVAFLFPGQGSQYPSMLRDLSMRFPEVRECFERADRELAESIPAGLSSYAFPLPAFSEEEAAIHRDRLMDTRIAQPALGAADVGAAKLLEALGIRAEMVAGHSYGEYVALHYAGVFDEQTLYRLSEARGRCLADSADDGAMAAVMAGEEAVCVVLESLDGVWLANLNSPQQTIISGAREAVEKAIVAFVDRGIDARPIPVSCAFHSPLMAPAQDAWRQELARVQLSAPSVEVYANGTTRPHSDSVEEIADTLVNHLVNPVRFAGEIEQMYMDGARIFVEVGPNNVLTGLVERTLEGRPFVAVSIDRPGRHGMVQLMHTLGRLLVHGVDIDLDRLFKGRRVKRLNLDRLEKPSIPPTAWRVSGGYARPYHEKPVEAKRFIRAAPTPQQMPAPSLPDLPSASATSSPVEAAGGEAEQAMIRHQQIMQQFLATQRNVMLAYLNRTQPAAQPAVRVDQSSAIEPSVATNPAPVHKEDVPDEQPPPAPLDASAIEKNLLDIVSERTGYPAEIIDVNLNLEADLGIDSIKRVEILGAFVREYLNGRMPDGFMEKLTRQKTLHGIANELAALSTTTISTAGDEQPVPPVVQLDRHAVKSIGRFQIVTVEKPFPESGVDLPVDSLVLITDDGRGIADALATRIRDAGHRAVIVRSGTEFERVDETTCRAALTDADSVESLVSHIRAEHGPAAGLIHILPLRDRTGEKPQQQLDLDVRSLFHLTKALQSDLDAGRLLAVTSMGGGFGFDGSMAGPTQGSVAGFVKTLRKEIDLLGRSVDFDGASPPEIVAGRLFDEWRAGDDEVEVGYRGESRMVVRSREASLNRSRPRVLPANPVVLITGGARGITAEIAIEMATRWQPQLVLVGSSPEPELEESAATAGVSDEAALKAVLMKHLTASREKVTLREVEKAFQRTLKEREIRRNMARMREAGALVTYLSVDVGDEAAFEKCIEDVYLRFGRLDGVVHGAGIIDDRLFAEKDISSFDRVLNVKVNSALTLSRTLQLDSLCFLVLFSSVSGRFGNRGQIDYAAANEVLNKLAVELDGKTPALVKSVDWAPWGQVGMVSPEVQRAFEARGIPLVDPEAGRKALCDEIEFGAKGDVEIILGDGPWRRGALPESSFPMLDGVKSDGAETPEHSAVRTFSIQSDLYLTDHRLDGNPVLPTSFALEWMVEYALSWSPGYALQEVTDLKVLNGIVMSGDRCEVRIVMQPRSGVNGQTAHFRSALVDPETGREYFRANLQLGREPLTSPTRRSLRTPLQAFPLTVDQAYEKWLFHGSRFEGILRFEGWNEEGMSALLRPSKPAENLAKTDSASWQIDPIVLDCAFQMALLWTRARADVTALPGSIRRFVQHAPFETEAIRCDLFATLHAGGHILDANFVFTDASGNMLATIEGMEFSCSRSLNRLGGQARKEAESV